jgi:DNA-directed RNA polymerase specialized sigma24 family protein
MGAVSVDVHAKERVLEVLYPMHTKEGVETFLEQLPYIEEAMYLSGDFDTLIMLLDYQDALENSGLTTSELTVLDAVFTLDMKRVDVAKMLDVTKQTVQTVVNRGLEKIANYYKEGMEKDEL